MTISKTDVLLIAIIVILALTVAAFAPAKYRADEIRFFADDHLVKCVKVGQDSIMVRVKIKSAEGDVDFIVQNGRVRAQSADCPNHICMRSGWKESPGEAIICAPNRIYAIITGVELEKVDAMLR